MRTRKRSSKAVRRRRRRFVVMVLSVLVLAGLAVAGASYVTRLSWWRVDTILVRGTDKVDPARVRALVEENIAGRYWLLFPRDNTLLLPKQAISTDLRDSFPRIKQFSLARDGLSGLEIKIEEREPYALWCGGQEGGTEGSNASSTPCYFIDRTGFVFARAPRFSDDVYPRLIDETPVAVNSIKIGEMYRKIRFEEISEFADAVETLGLKPRSIIPQAQQDVTIVLADGRYLLINQKSDLDQVFQNLRLLLTHKDLDLSVEDVDTFSYIDLRFGKRVFYKPNDDGV